MTATRPSFAPWDERTSPRIVSPEESARRVRAFAAFEEKAAQILEAFGPSMAEDHAQATLARHARHHAFHAEILRERVADASGSKGDAADDADLAAFLDAVAEPKDADQAVELLTGVYRVLLPRAITAYTYLLTALGSDATDADARWFELILKDSFDSIRDGELLLQSLLGQGGEAAVQRSADRRAALEAQMVKIGGLVGPDSLGGNNPQSPKNTENK
ncbi:MAG TPA: hypothetical protein VM143_07255 [Acidimicrobiales bacterium]|nr:hypothetical protein [Acidimicrobiales bacterium]